MTDSLQLTSGEAEVLVRALEAATHVQGRKQFYAWTQSHVACLLPHQLIVCGSWQRRRRGVVFDVLERTPVSALTLAPLADAESALMRGLVHQWIGGGGRALAIDPATLARDAQHQAAQLCRDAGSRNLLLHGVARPQRLAELESLFVFTVDAPCGAKGLQTLELLLPHVHSAWRRVQRIEGEPSDAAAFAVERLSRPHLVTERERQILSWIRQGKSNPEIGQLLRISPLTVKNHVQKILRKLQAADRTQAVAHAIAMKLLGRDESWNH